MIKKYMNNHKCVTGQLDSDCPICMNELQNSNLKVSVTHCGHAIHSKCLKLYIKSNQLACPICKKCLYDID